MTERTRNMVVGTTLLAALIALGFLIVLFDEVPAALSNTYVVHVDLTNANGLSSGSRVTLNGLDIGFVEAMRIKDNPAEGVEADCRISGRFDIPTNVEVLALASPFGGGGLLDFVVRGEALEGAPAYLPRDGSMRLTGRPTSLGIRLERIAERIDTHLRAQLERFGAMADEITVLARQYTEVGRKVETLIEPRDPAEVDRGDATANLHSAIVRADAGLKEMRELLAGAQAIVNDPTFQSDVKATAANARALTESANEQLDTLARKFTDVADELSVSLDHINALLTDVRAGKGTVGKLMQQDELYNALDDAAKRLSDALREFQLMLQKWSAEGVPVQF